MGERKDSGKYSPHRNKSRDMLLESKEMRVFSISLSCPGREYLKYNL